MAYTFKTDFLKDYPAHRTNGKMPSKAKGVAIHNAATTTDARNLAIYGNYNSPEVSFHFAVDESYVYHNIPLDWTSWCQGTPEGNNYYWSIEIARDLDYKTDRYARAEENAAILTAKLLSDAGLTIDGLKRHHDFIAGGCPHRMFEVERGQITGRTWTQFKQLVELLMKKPEPEPELDTIPEPKEQLVYLKAGTEIRRDPPTQITMSTLYTIVERQGSWGKLKSGVGWVRIPED